MHKNGSLKKRIVGSKDDLKLEVGKEWIGGGSLKKDWDVRREEEKQIGDWSDDTGREVGEESRTLKPKEQNVDWEEKNWMKTSHQDPILPEKPAPIQPKKMPRYKSSKSVNLMYAYCSEKLSLGLLKGAQYSHLYNRYQNSETNKLNTRALLEYFHQWKHRLRTELNSLLESTLQTIHHPSPQSSHPPPISPPSSTEPPHSHSTHPNLVAPNIQQPSLENIQPLPTLVNENKFKPGFFNENESGLELLKSSFSNQLRDLSRLLKISGELGSGLKSVWTGCYINKVQALRSFLEQYNRLLQSVGEILFWVDKIRQSLRVRFEGPEIGGLVYGSLAEQVTEWKRELEAMFRQFGPLEELQYYRWSLVEFQIKAYFSQLCRQALAFFRLLKNLHSRKQWLHQMISSLANPNSPAQLLSFLHQCEQSLPENLPLHPTPSALSLSAELTSLGTHLITQITHSVHQTLENLATTLSSTSPQILLENSSITSFSEEPLSLLKQFKSIYSSSSKVLKKYLPDQSKELRKKGKIVTEQIDQFIGLRTELGRTKVEAEDSLLKFTQIIEKVENCLNKILDTVESPHYRHFSPIRLTLTRLQECLQTARDHSAKLAGIVDSLEKVNEKSLSEIIRKRNQTLNSYFSSELPSLLTNADTFFELKDSTFFKSHLQDLGKRHYIAATTWLVQLKDAYYRDTTNSQELVENFFPFCEKPLFFKDHKFETTLKILAQYALELNLVRIFQSDSQKVQAYDIATLETQLEARRGKYLDPDRIGERIQSTLSLLEPILRVLKSESTLKQRLEELVNQAKKQFHLEQETRKFVNSIFTAEYYPNAQFFFDWARHEFQSKVLSIWPKASTHLKAESVASYLEKITSFSATLENNQLRSQAAEITAQLKLLTSFLESTPVSIIIHTIANLLLSLRISFSAIFTADKKILCIHSQDLKDIFTTLVPLETNPSPESLTQGFITLLPSEYLPLFKSTLEQASTPASEHILEDQKDFREEMPEEMSEEIEDDTNEFMNQDQIHQSNQSHLDPQQLPIYQIQVNSESEFKEFFNNGKHLLERTKQILDSEIALKCITPLSTDEWTQIQQGYNLLSLKNLQEILGLKAGERIAALRNKLKNFLETKNAGSEERILRLRELMNSDGLDREIEITYTGKSNDRILAIRNDSLRNKSEKGEEKETYFGLCILLDKSPLPSTPLSTVGYQAVSRAFWKKPGDFSLLKSTLSKIVTQANRKLKSMKEPLISALKKILELNLTNKQEVSSDIENYCTSVLKRSEALEFEDLLISKASKNKSEISKDQTENLELMDRLCRRISMLSFLNSCLLQSHGQAFAILDNQSEARTFFGQILTAGEVREISKGWLKDCSRGLQVDWRGIKKEVMEYIKSVSMKQLSPEQILEGVCSGTIWKIISDELELIKNSEQKLDSYCKIHRVLNQNPHPEILLMKENLRKQKQFLNRFLSLQPELTIRSENLERKIGGFFVLRLPLKENMGLNLEQHQFQLIYQLVEGRLMKIVNRKQVLIGLANNPSMAANYLGIPPEYFSVEDKDQQKQLLLSSVFVTFQVQFCQNLLGKLGPNRQFLPQYEIQIKSSIETRIYKIEELIGKTTMIKIQIDYPVSSIRISLIDKEANSEEEKIVRKDQIRLYQPFQTINLKAATSIWEAILCEVSARRLKFAAEEEILSMIRARQEREAIERYQMEIQEIEGRKRVEGEKLEKEAKEKKARQEKSREQTLESNPSKHSTQKQERKSNSQLLAHSSIETNKLAQQIKSSQSQIIHPRTQEQNETSIDKFQPPNAGYSSIKRLSLSHAPSHDVESLSWRLFEEGRSEKSLSSPAMLEYSSLKESEKKGDEFNSDKQKGGQPIKVEDHSSKEEELGKSEEDEQGIEILEANNFFKRKRMSFNQLERAFNHFNTSILQVFAAKSFDLIFSFSERENLQIDYLLSEGWEPCNIDFYNELPANQRTRFLSRGNFLCNPDKKKKNMLSSSHESQAQERGRYISFVLSQKGIWVRGQMEGFNFPSNTQKIEARKDKKRVF